VHGNTIGGMLASLAGWDMAGGARYFEDRTATTEEAFLKRLRDCVAANHLACALGFTPL